MIIVHRKILRNLTWILGRIHFSIHYPDLDAKARRQIWKQFISKAFASSGARTGTISEEDADKLAKHEMNGRQVCPIPQPGHEDLG